jgi:hypothetical protein
MSFQGHSRRLNPLKCLRCGSPDIIFTPLVPRCRECGFEPSQALFRLPRDIPVLADTLGLPLDTVTQMLGDGTIPVRRAWGNPRGRRIVLILDAIKAIQGQGPEARTSREKT